MRIRWLSASERDLVRLYDFLGDVAPRTAARNIQTILAAVRRLPEYPRVGHVIEEYQPREVRALFVSDYEVRYEIAGDWLIVLRVWHTREDR